ncbi:MAG: hypothetical protein ACHQNE_03010 [Candidatus Kapaibacterium sp.]
MTIIAQLNSLSDAYEGMAALRSKAIPPALSKQGEVLVISVDDDFANSARQIFLGDDRFANATNLPDRLNDNGLLPGFEEYNA